MTDELEICISCQKPKRSNASASLTQWIATCVCDLKPDPSVTEAIAICQTCEKRIGRTRKGSLTQYIFQPNYCSCQKPKAGRLKTRDFYQAPEIKQEYFDENEVLSVDEDQFPEERYKPYRVLGEGAHSSVYLCRDTILNKKVAVKVLKNLHPRELIEFQKEAKSTSRLKHPLIIEILDFGVTKANVPYMVLEYFSGESLLSFLEKHEKLEWQLALAVMIEICIALAYSNSNGIMHRDIKPGNILIRIDKEGYPVIRMINFGLAGLAKEADESIAGTPAYMSPDVPGGRKYSFSSEVYSCGIILFELLTGEVPFKGQTAIETLNAHATKQAPPVSTLAEVPKAIDQIIFKCIAKDPDDRFADPNELRQSLEACFDQINKKEQEIAGLSVSGKLKNTILSALPLVLIFLILGGAIIFFKNVLEQSKSKKLVSEKLKPKKHDVNDLFFIVEKNGQFLVTDKGQPIKDSDLALLRRELDGKERIKISLAQLSIDGTGFKYLINLPVEELIADFCVLKPESGNYIKGMRDLQILILRNCDITDDFIKNLGVHPKISNLEVSGSQLTDGIIPFIASYPKLSNLVINSGKFTDRSLTYLANRSKITQLSVNHNNITSTGIKALRKLPGLFYLDVSSISSQNKEFLKAIASLPALTIVRFGGDLKIEPQDFLILKESNSLNEIIVNELRPASKFMPYISKLNKLNKVTLDDSDISDSDLHWFLKMKNLKRLNIGAAPNLTVKALKQFEKKLPENFEFECTALKSNIDQYADLLK